MAILLKMTFRVVYPSGVEVAYLCPSCGAKLTQAEQSGGKQHDIIKNIESAAPWSKNFLFVYTHFLNEAQRSEADRIGSCKTRPFSGRNYDRKLEIVSTAS